MDEMEQAGEVLSSLRDKELREVLFEVFKKKRPNSEEDAYNHNCFFLGTASIFNEAEVGAPESWGDPQIHAVAYIDRELCPESLGPGWGFCQQGTCTSCHTLVRSNYKDGICPVCSARVRMT